ncbi:MAG: zinc ABC transporter substrate-binding protein [Bacteroidales bacterium]|nr:zinc ABC transporter substrate-binding protein [Bacteroidales bacterium]
MEKYFYFLLILFFTSCGQQNSDNRNRIITVSIAPFKYFVEEIAGDDFVVNIMVPAGSNPHIYEPFPEQINKLRRSEAYISNGYLGFEMTWLDRFYEINKTMRKLSLADKINPLVSEHHHEGESAEGADPHYWVSPECALIIASSVKELLCDMNPSQRQKYETSYNALILKIQDTDKHARDLFSSVHGRSFMIFHPNLGYLARDYGLEEISVEYEGKEPPPSRMKELIDRARKDGLKTIFVQKEYDTKNAKAIADEIGAEIRIIDPLSEDWLQSTSDIISALYSSLKESSN